MPQHTTIPMTKRPLSDAHVLLQCMDSNHYGTCIEMRDSILEKFGDISEAIVIQQVNGEEDFCVCADAKITPKKLKLFAEALKKESKVQDVRVYLEV